MIVNGDIIYPNDVQISEKCKDFIQKLLEKTPEARLSALNEILSHPWLENLDHCAIGEKTIGAPFVPEFDGEIDTSFFDPIYTQQEIRLTIVDPKNKKLQESFKFLEEFESE